MRWQAAEKASEASFETRHRSSRRSRLSSKSKCALSIEIRTPCVASSAHARRMCPGLEVPIETGLVEGRASAVAGARVDTPDREDGAHVRGGGGHCVSRERCEGGCGIGEAAASAHRGWKCFVACSALRRVPCSRGLSLTRACVFFGPQARRASERSRGQAHAAAGAAARGRAAQGRPCYGAPVGGDVQGRA
jgi:hypothetical protein